MSKNPGSAMFRTILLAADGYHMGAPVQENSIALAKKLGASLHVSYVVDLEELKVLAAGPPGGAIVSRAARHGAKEKRLVAEGQQCVENFQAACKDASVLCHSHVLVGTSERLWAVQARGCHLVLVNPVEKDFRTFSPWSGSMLWRIADRACRPVLLMRRTGPPTGGAILFYSNRKRAATSLPWVAALCSTLEMSVTVYTAAKVDGEVSYREECRDFLAQHGVQAALADEKAVEIMKAEADEPSTALPSQSLLVFDHGYHSLLWFRKRERLMQRMIRNSPHGILLCP